MSYWSRSKKNPENRSEIRKGEQLQSCRIELEEFKFGSKQQAINHVVFSKNSAPLNLKLHVNTFQNVSSKHPFDVKILIRNGTRHLL